MKHNDLELLEYLLDQGYTSNEEVLYTAARKATPATLDLLLKNSTTSLDTLLFHAVSGNNEDTARYLLEKGATPNTITLNEAAGEDNLRFLKLLIEEYGAVPTMGTVMAAEEREVSDYLLEKVPE